jgi:YVTN family beta-propeller protein
MFNQAVHRPGAGNRQYWYGMRAGTLITVALIVLVSLLHPSRFNGIALHPSEAIAAPTRSTTIALTSDEERLVVVNREANSVSIIRVKDEHGHDVYAKLDEIGVGEEPRCVAVHPTDRAAYVTNGITGTVSVVDLVQRREVKQIKVGTEPRGCALTPDGSLLYVANHTAGTVSIIDTAGWTVWGTVFVGRNPTAIAITDKGTGHIADDTVFVTQIFAELDPDFKDPNFDGNGEARDLGKLGVVHAFPAGKPNPPITKITLAPLPDSGFSANRVMPNNFCNTVPPAQSNIFCPNPDDSTDPANTNNPQGVFANQLLSAVIRGNLLYVTAIGPQPEPPEIFNVNVQALVYAVDTEALAEVAVGAKFKNLNVQIAKEAAAPPPSLDKTFGNDIVAIDADGAGHTFLIVSRGGNQLFRAHLVDPATGQLNILNTAGDKVACRLRQQRGEFLGHVREHR